MQLQPFGYPQLFTWMEHSPIAHWLPQVAQLSEELLGRHGDMPRWLAALEALPAIERKAIDLRAPCIRVEPMAELSPEALAQLGETLMAFHPWRKGPFCPCGIHLDTEWRSDWKWGRIERALDLSGKTILDVGCGNGYYGWRMLGAGAARVIGIDPTIGYVMQYAAMQHFIGEQPMHVLPLKLEEIPAGNGAFDVVFSMGVIYHRKEHMEHLQQLTQHLRPGGELVLEGLVIEGGPGDLLHPNGRYAKMKNVHTLPSPATMAQWLEVAGFADIEIIDVSPTTTEEQRRTPWMHFESLVDYLDPDDPSKTVEGHPAPLRAILKARSR